MDLLWCRTKQPRNHLKEILWRKGRAQPCIRPSASVITFAKKQYRYAWRHALQTFDEQSGVGVAKLRVRYHQIERIPI
jgi:hypothetical protein